MANGNQTSGALPMACSVVTAAPRAIPFTCIVLTSGQNSFEIDKFQAICRSRTGSQNMMMLLGYPRLRGRQS